MNCINDLFEHIKLSELIRLICIYCKIVNYIYYTNKKEINKDSGPGIYFIIVNKEIKHIGTAEDLKTRFHGHKKYKAGDKIIFFPMSDRKAIEIKRIQHGLICLLWPEENNLSKYDRIN